MRILIIGDLHGQMPHIPKGEFDYVIAPGDFGSDEGIREYVWQAYREWLEDPENAREWWEIPDVEEAKRLAKNSVGKGRAVLERLDRIGVPVFVVPGNWDWTGTNIDEDANTNIFGTEDVWNDLLMRDLKNVHDAAYARIDMPDLTVIGYGPVNGPELVEHRDPEAGEEEVAEHRLDYEELIEIFDALFEDAKKPVILLAHTVPYGTKIDIIDNPDSPKNGMHFGSDLVRYLCEKHRPTLCVGGHMHEHFGTDMIGDTTCLNTGFGPDVHTIIEFEGDKIVRLELFGND